jgi:hypothetical protein
VSNTTVNHNTYLGKGAGTLNKTGGGNIAIGFDASYGGEGGLGNCSIGYKAGYANNGEYNVFLGHRSGYQNISGVENSFLGRDAGYFNTNGQLNTFVGSKSGFNNSVGIANAFLGNKSGYSNSTGSNNAFFGYGAGYDNVTGEKNTYLGYASGGSTNLVNATAIGANAKVTASNSIVMGNNANVGIGVSAPTYQLQLSTDAAAKLGTSLWTIWSDRRLKKDISDFTDGLQLLKEIKPVWFSYNGEAGIKTNKKFVGVIAQDMQQIAPYTIGSFVYEDSLGHKTEYLDYDASAVTYILINAVKEQQAIIEQKQKLIDDLSERLTKLEDAMTAARTGSAETQNTGNAEPGNSVTVEQNAPNGFSQDTSIKFYIPKRVKTAEMNIYTEGGLKVGSHPINERGQGQLTISANKLKEGLYLYDLITDGKSNGARKMGIKPKCCGLT